MQGRTRIVGACAGLFCSLGAAAWAAESVTVPLCPGLTVVTAVNQPNGDYESIKTVESLSASELRLKYSSEAPDNDLFATAPTLKRTVVHRKVLISDLRNATIYEQIFLDKSAETFPGTTAIGVSAAVLGALKSKGQARLSLSNAYAGVQLSADPKVRPNYRDYLQPGTLRRAGSGTVLFRVLVNDQPVDLPAIRAEGDFSGDKAEFYFLDDERNPLTLAFRLGIGAVKPLDAGQLAFCETLRRNHSDPLLLARSRCDRPGAADREALRVIKIAYGCTAGASALEQALARGGKVDVYSIYFGFNSETLREESEPTLREIADVLRRHPDWRLRVSGHTDAIGGDAYNLELSKRRAAAVKDALVKRYAIDATRLAIGGYGRTQPRDTNDTLEGRARNRRVELMRG